jgi:hypothetical protein
MSMTSGFAKPRVSLPYLPYGKSCRVIINPHNFGSPFAVNGKVPVSVWIPSLDTAGNGTTTLNDLVGSNNGTLTNFALSGSTSNWVSDTGAGGTVALDYDATNDFVRLASDPLKNRSTISVALWFKLNSVAAGSRGLFGGWNNAVIGAMLFRASASNLQLFFSSASQVQTGGTFFTGLLANTWYHAMVTYDNTTIRVYLDGVLSATTVAMSGQINPSATQPVQIGGGGASQGNLDGRIDDCRLSYDVWNLADAQYLWNAGNGRARVT